MIRFECLYVCFVLSISPLCMKKSPVWNSYNCYSSVEKQDWGTWIVHEILERTIFFRSFIFCATSLAPSIHFSSLFRVHYDIDCSQSLFLSILFQLFSSKRRVRIFWMDAEEEDEEDDDEEEEEVRDMEEGGNNPVNQSITTLEDTTEECDMEEEANKENTSFSASLS